MQSRIVGSQGALTLSDDCETLRYDDGEVLFGDSGRNELRQAFVAFARGDAAQNKTPLRSTYYYLLATNAMLLSSGGIHPIAESCIRPIHPGTDEGVYSVNHLASYLAQSAEALAPLREALVPWAQKVPSLPTSDFAEDDLARLYGLSPTAFSPEIEWIPESAARG